MTTYNTGNPLGSAVPKDLFDNSQSLDEAINTDADSWRDRFGRERLSMAGMQRLSSPAVAIDAAQRAESAGRRAEAARDSAIINAGKFIDEASGRAAVADGAYFLVQGDGEIAAHEFRRVSASQSVFVTSYPSCAYIDSSIEAASHNLLRIERVDTFPFANLRVRRYTSASAVTDYPAGQFQTATPTGLLIQPPVSGSVAIKFFYRTGRIWSGVPLQAHCVIQNQHGKEADGPVIGFGYLRSDGVYVGYGYSSSGVFRRIEGFSQTNLTPVLTPVSDGDRVTFALEAGTIQLYVNGTQVHTHSLEPAEFAGELLIVQSGYTWFSVAFEGREDPLRDYVREQIQTALIDSGAPVYYEYDGDSVFRAYAHVARDLYVGFDVRHEHDMSDLMYVDYWRITRADFYEYRDGRMSATGRAALGIGESEFVFKQDSSKDDFTGGYHGDEIATDARFFADGQLLNLNAPLPLTPASNVEYIVKSTMHETASDGVVVPGHPIIAYHTKHTQFENSGYRVRNIVRWNYAGVLSTLYHGISCIHKDVAAVVFSDADYADQQMTGSGVNYFNAVGSRLYRGRNDVTGLAVEASATQYKVAGADELSVLFVHDRSTDSKYYRKSPARDVAIGEQHESLFECRFFGDS